MKISVVIPAHNEADCIENTVQAMTKLLKTENIPHEILVINDNSSDDTENVLKNLSSLNINIRYINNVPPHGYGFAVRKGLENFTGDCLAISMADASDRPEDLVRYYRTLIEKNVECVFGNRWARESKVVDYPFVKFILNRTVNFMIRILFGIKYNDVTNAFKLFRREVIEGLRPFLSHHFNLTVELPLKAIVRGYTYAVVPNDWINRTTGVSKLKIKEMGSRYLFIIFYCLIEKWLSAGDYFRKDKTRNQRMIS